MCKYMPYVIYKYKLESYVMTQAPVAQTVKTPV